MDRENKEILEREIDEKPTMVVVDGSNFNKQIYFDIIQNLFEDILFSIDIKTKVLSHNGERAASEFGLPPVIENFPMSLVNAGAIYPDDLGVFMAYGYDMLAGNGGSHEVRIRKGDGTYEWFSIKSTTLKNEAGEVVEVLGRLRNVQEEKEVQVRAMTDALTKTQNRLTFEENVEFILKSSKNDEEHALLFIDLDDFKYVNDTFGHTYGDFVLTSLADRIKNRVQKNDYVGRVGGDEFVVFMKGIAGEEIVKKRAEQLLEDLRSKYCDGTKEHMVKVSIGVARYPHDGSTYGEMYDKADKALYRSKHLGKDTVTVFNENK